MRIITKDEISKPLLAEKGEIIYEMIGRPQEIGGTTHHSFVHVVIPARKLSPAHYHKVSEETYYILEGRAHMVINGNEFTLSRGQACLIMPSEVHQIFNNQEKDLEFIAVSAPAWTPDDSIFV
jgi:mannose-6-phosphate isomerase-like protein (cupin superfamily)